MKAFAIVLLCALAAVQGRYTALQSTRSVAALGENPWLVHLRIAVASSGLLNTGVGTLISNNWVLTTAENVIEARFVWSRFGVVNVINPTLVLEVSAAASFRVHPDYDAVTGKNNIALILLTRPVETTDNIAPLGALGGEVAESARFCNFGGDDKPGEQLSCSDVTVEQAEDGSLTVSSDEVVASAFDSGAALISNGAQVGLLVGPGSEGSVGEFIAIADHLEWIEQETGLNLSPEAAPEDPEAVRFIQ